MVSPALSWHLAGGAESAKGLAASRATAGAQQALAARGAGLPPSGGLRRLPAPLPALYCNMGVPNNAAALRFAVRGCWPPPAARPPALSHAVEGHFAAGAAAQPRPHISPQHRLHIQAHNNLSLPKCTPHSLRPPTAPWITPSPAPPLPPPAGRCSHFSAGDVPREDLELQGSVSQTGARLGPVAAQPSRAVAPAARRPPAHRCRPTPPTGLPTPYHLCRYAVWFMTAVSCSACVYTVYHYISDSPDFA